MYLELDILDLVINIIDREIALINAHYAVLLNSEYMLCVWYINKNVTANCKQYFEIKEA